jgi:hypothetical protein
MNPLAARISELQKTIAFASQELLTISQSLERKVDDTPDAPPDILAIQDIVCEFYGLPMSAMTTPSKISRIVLPRMVAMSLCRDHTSHCPDTIARAFNRERSTVSWACIRVNEHRANEPRLTSVLALLNEAIRERLDKGTPRVQAVVHEEDTSPAADTPKTRPLPFPGLKEAEVRLSRVLPETHRVLAVASQL